MRAVQDLRASEAVGFLFALKEIVRHTVPDRDQIDPDGSATSLGTMGRMALEILLFRSLFRNNAASLRAGPRPVYDEEETLWLGVPALHWSLLIWEPAFSNVVGTAQDSTIVVMPAAAGGIPTVGIVTSICAFSNLKNPREKGCAQENRMAVDRKPFLRLAG